MSKTEENLKAAFAGESQARNRYTYFASVARDEGYQQIMGIFLDTAENEKEHAKREFEFLKGGEVEITASFPAGVIGTTAENLKASAAAKSTILVCSLGLEGQCAQQSPRISRHPPQLKVPSLFAHFCQAPVSLANYRNGCTGLSIFSRF